MHSESFEIEQMISGNNVFIRSDWILSESLIQKRCVTNVYIFAHLY